MADIGVPSGRAGLSPFQPVTIGMGSNVLVASEVTEDAGFEVLADAIAFGGVVWKEASIVDCVDSYTALYIDGSHGSLDKKWVHVAAELASKTMTTFDAECFLYNVRIRCKMLSFCQAAA